SAGTSIGPKLSVSERVVVVRAMMNIRRANETAGRISYSLPKLRRQNIAADYFLRKRSSRTTSAPALGFSGSFASSAAGSAAAAGTDAAAAGSPAFRVSSLASSGGPNFQPQ